MSAAPLYNQAAAGSALYALSPAAAHGWAGFWSPDTLSQTSLTLDQAWSATDGVYLFCAVAPTDTAAMAAGLAQIIPALSPAGLLRMAWIGDPNLPVDHWQVDVLLARESGTNWTVARAVTWLGGGYGLYLPAGAALTQSSANDIYGIAVGGTGGYFLAPQGAFDISASSALIPLSGSGIGAIGATLAVSGSEGDAFQQLSAGLRYCYPTLTARTGAVDRLDMPLVSQNGLSFSLYLTYFPGALPDPNLSSLSFFPSSGTGSVPTLPCYLRTVLGYATTLTPKPAQNGVAAARFVFGVSPRWVPDDRRNLASMAYHLCPDGAFTIGTDTQPEHEFHDPHNVVDRVMLGASGTEYAGLTSLTECVVLFAGGAPAYAPALVNATQTDTDPVLLTSDATTSAATFLPPVSDTGNLIYFAQPRQSPLYQAGDTGFLDFMSLPAALFSTSEAQLPLGIYAGVNDDKARAARLLDQAVLAPARNQAAMAGTGDVRTQTGGTAVQGVTPPGLSVTVSQDLSTWQTLVMAQMNEMTPQSRSFSSVSKDLQAALQSDQLFFVVATPSVLAPPVDQCPNGECTSVQYRLDPKTLAILAEEGVDPTTIAALTTGLSAQGYPTFATKNAFVAEVKSLAPNVSEEDEAKILAIAGQLSIEIDHWTFQLSPDSWRIDPSSPTMMLVKYANATLEDLVNDTSRWGYPDAAGNKSATQKLIQDIFDAAREAWREDRASPYADFYQDIVSNAAWNGFLFLNAPVNMAELPTELLFLTAGIDASRFYAHHIAIGATPYKSESSTLVLGQSSISGLIDYTDETDLVMEATVPYAFKTQQLTAVFKNTALVDFKAKCELMVNRLFDAETLKVETVHGNNLVLSGGYQRQNGEPVYSFVLTGLNDYNLLRSALGAVSIAAVQIQTAATDATHIQVSFLLSGKMRFVEQPTFDLFSYGVPLTAGDQTPSDADSALAFSNLAVLMAFDLGNPAVQTFTAIPNNVAFDLVNSKPRTASLANRFPLKLTGLTVGTKIGTGTDASSTSPADLGYSGVNAPIDASIMTAPWYGLTFDLDMGTLGALSGGRPLIMSVLTAWCVGVVANDQPIYLGLKMPDARPLGIDWPLQGVLHLGFRSFDFTASGEGETRAYMLRMRRFGLSALGISFPPGNLDVFMFGDPAGGNTGKLGWYAAYAPDSTSKTKSVPGPRAANVRMSGPAAERLTRTERARRNGRRLKSPNPGL